MQAIDASENVDFNLHTHVECNSPLLPDPKTIVISTHALTWSATKTIWQNLQPIWKISTHALTWSATCYRAHCSTGTNHFNSRTHVECDVRHSEPCAASSRISTHALTWSATTRRPTQLFGVMISTHALTWSATRDGVGVELHAKNFNSRTHVECDDKRNTPT